MSVKCAFLCLILVASSYCDKKHNKNGNGCNVNEQYSTCGSRCSEICPYTNGPNGKNGHGNCQSSCTSGCFCCAGFARNKHGVCVQSSQCSTHNGSGESSESYNSCGPKEEYKSSNRCYEKCPGLRVLANCPTACKPGCWCKENHSRNANGNCVKTHKCGMAQG